MAESEKICKNCLWWIPNGGVLGMGYCIANKYGYRKPQQTCVTKSSDNKYLPREILTAIKKEINSIGGEADKKIVAWDRRSSQTVAQ